MSDEMRWPRLLGFIVGTEVVGAAGSVFTARAIPDWYSQLRKPSFNPPNWVFGPVWTILYALMGWALYLVSEHSQDRTVVRLAEGLYGLQLVLNTLWTWIFFGRRSIAFALVEIAFLWLAILLTVLAFSRVSKRAALLLVPYLVWVTFASVLNYRIWRLND